MLGKNNILWLVEGLHALCWMILADILHDTAPVSDCVGMGFSFDGMDDAAMVDKALIVKEKRRTCILEKSDR
jgi:hypothetical protein